MIDWVLDKGQVSGIRVWFISRHGVIGRLTPGHHCEFPVSSSNSSGRIYVSPCLPARYFWQPFPASSTKNYCTHPWRSVRHGRIHLRSSHVCWTNGGDELLHKGYWPIIARAWEWNVWRIWVGDISLSVPINWIFAHSNCLLPLLENSFSRCLEYQANLQIWTKKMWQKQQQLKHPVMHWLKF